MRIKLDENLPAGLLSVLSHLGHDVDSVPLEGIASAPDRRVWQAAQEANRFLITQDLDFSDVRQFAPGTHYGILLVRLRAPSRRALTRKIQIIFETEHVESWKRSFVVATDHKIRVRPPEQ